MPPISWPLWPRRRSAASVMSSPAGQGKRQRRTVVRPELPGAAALVLPPLFFLMPSFRHSAPGFVLAAGLPALALLSLGFLVLRLPALMRASRRIGDIATAIPDFGRIGEPLETRTDPDVPTFLPGVRLQVIWVLRFGPFRRRIVAPLPVGRESGAAVFRFDRRGLWMGSVRLRAVDPFGFFAVDLPLAGRCGTAVPPYLFDPTPTPPPGRPSADAKTAPRLREDAEELYERRDYIPGDDPRRIDWKQYARTGDFLVRVGEDSLPHRGRTWILAVGSSTRFPRREGYDRLDLCLEAAAELVRGLTENGGEVRLRFPGDGPWLDASRSDWEAALASAEPGPASAGDLPPRGESLLIVAHPSDSAAPVLAAAARDAGCGVSLVFPSGRAGPPAAPGRWWRYRDGRAFSADLRGLVPTPAAVGRRRVEAAAVEARSGGFDVHVL